MFELHPRLSADTIFVKRLEICGIHLMNDKRYPWVILVPEIENLTELHELSDANYSVVMEEIRQVSKAMDRLYSPKKLNIGALGNLVPQLHIHIICRYENDETWPGPVWGVGAAQPYSASQIKKQIADLQISLK